MGLSHGISRVTGIDERLGNREGLFPDDAVIFGKSEQMLAIRSRLRAVSNSSVPVLIGGESGTGKELIARLIHYLSPVGNGPFVKVSCPAIPGTLFESELFGYESGAFTGAHNQKPGRVTLASGGTLFLDEIGELDAALQSKLLQVLQDGKFCPIGGQQDKTVEVRVICATNRDLEEEIANGRFRQDLFYRINVVNLHLAPLRDRIDDIPILAEYFLKHYNDKFNCRARPLSSPLLNEMLEYHWPGNIRQLENLIKRYVVLGGEEVISAELSSKERLFKMPEIDLERTIYLKKVTKQVVRDVERRIILKVLQAHQWNRKKAAKALNISYRALLYKIKEAQLLPPSTVNWNDEELAN